MEAHVASAGHPVLPCRMGSQPRELSPGLATVARAEKRGVLDAGIDRVWIGMRGCQVPHPLEFLRMWCAIVPLVRAGGALLGELVANRLP
jgi:hypothetical protein